MSEERSLSLLVHGASKSGKSTLSVTAPPPRLYMDVESASRFLPITRVEWDPAQQPPPQLDGRWDTAVVKTRNWVDVQRAYAWLASGQHQFRSFIIDSISELQQRYIEDSAGRVQPTLQQWGDVFRGVAGLLRDIRDLTMHPTNPIESIVMTSMTVNVEGAWRPYVQGQLKIVMPYVFDVVGYLYNEEVVAENPLDPTDVTTTEVRRMLTKRRPGYEAGERVGGRLSAVIDNPNVADMIESIFGPLTLDPEPQVPEAGPPAPEAPPSEPPAGE